MKEKKKNSEVLSNLVSALPPFCQGFYITRIHERSLLSRIGYARDAKAFLEWLSSKKFDNKNTWEITASELGEVSPVDIDTYLLDYSSTHKDSSVSRSRCAISSLYKYLSSTLNLVPRNPADGAGKVKRSKANFVIHLTLEEQKYLIGIIMSGTKLNNRQQKFHNKLRSRDVAIFTLFLDTGIRISELCGIDVGDIDLDDFSVIVRRKGGKIEKVFFSDECAIALSHYIAERNAYFPTSNGFTFPLFLTIAGNRISTREVQKLTKKYTDIAFPNKSVSISPHKLRSSFAMSFYGETGNLLALQKKLGHESIVSTNVYAKATELESKALRNWK